MDDRAVHAGGLHLRQRILGRIGRILAVMRAHLPVLPDVDLGIDYQHGLLL
jgi:hypothetical protein